MLMSKYLQSLYLMLFILMKAMPNGSLTPITTTLSTQSCWSQKCGKPLILMIVFYNFRYFDMTSVMTSQSCHT